MHSSANKQQIAGARVKRALKYAGLALVSAFFLIGGQAHFTASAFFVSIVPPYVPFPLAAVYVTGVLELIGAVAIWVPRWRSWAGDRAGSPDRVRDSSQHIYVDEPAICG